MEYREEQKVCVAGIITKRVNKQTRKGDSMAFVTLEDKSGEIEVVVFPGQLSTMSHLLMVDSAVMITGNITIREDENAKLKLQSAAALLTNEEIKKQIHVAEKKKDPSLYLKVSSVDSPEYKKAYAFCEIFKGSIPVVIYEESTGKRYKSSNFGVKVSDFTMKELKEILGEDSVVLK
jgi:DNA polymerase-3 subunit alpha